MPHFCLQVDELEGDRLFSLAKILGHHSAFSKGANINFYRSNEKEEVIGVLSFERGVEDFTLTCGSAVTSVFYYLYKQDPLLESIISQIPAGEFGVRKDKDNQLYLLGQALRVY